jgi:uncharacterized metal-binding protein
MIAWRANRVPVVYSCSGCSSAARMANFIALHWLYHGTGEARACAAKPEAD